MARNARTANSTRKKIGIPRCQVPHRHANCLRRNEPKSGAKYKPTYTLPTEEGIVEVPTQFNATQLVVALAVWATQRSGGGEGDAGACCAGTESNVDEEEKGEKEAGNKKRREERGGGK